jgi:hypothetical protein
MPDFKDQKTEIVRLVPADGSIVHRKETLTEISEDESVSKEVKVVDLTVHSCQHSKGYGFSCLVCRRSYCEDCRSRIKYCEKCQATLGPCCAKEMHDRTVYCPEHKPLIDWPGPVIEVLDLLICLGSLALTLYLLYRFVG